MANRKVPLVNGEFYHVYNRGVDKRTIFQSSEDLDRFFESMRTFNSVDPSGSIFEQRLIQKGEIPMQKNNEKLVRFVAYCLLPNHFHFILEQVADGGISEFMKRLSGGYTTYFNLVYKRKGSLFQGTFKSIHLDTEEYLQYVSAYVNLNHKQKEEFGGLTPKLVKSSWEEYLGVSEEDFCRAKEIVCAHFSGSNKYEKFALEVLESVKENKEKYKDLEE